MDNVKNPAVMGSAIAVAAIAGTAVFLTKQTNSIKEDITSINEEINILKTNDIQEKKNDVFLKAIDILSKNLTEISNKIDNLSRQVYVINETLVHNDMKIPENLRRRGYDHRQAYSEYSSHHISSAPVSQQRDPISDEIRSVMSSIRQ